MGDVVGVIIFCCGVYLLMLLFGVMIFVFHTLIVLFS